MGNQEAKQKKAAAASGCGSYPSLAEGWREGGGDSKKGAKKISRHGGKGTGSTGEGGGGGMQGTAPAKKKNKAESKSSVFSIRKKKGNLKGKGDACSSGTGSKEDVLACQHGELDSTKSPEISADELGQSDTEAAFSEKKTNVGQGRKDANGRQQKPETQRKASTAAASPTEDGGQKGGSSGSDTDIYSFHSAAEHEDLLADIQLAIRLQHQQQHRDVNFSVEAQKSGEKDLIVGESDGRMKQSNGVVKLTPIDTLSPELELGSDALSFLESETLSCSFKHMELPPKQHTEEQERREEEEHLELNGKGQSEEQGEASPFIDTKDQYALPKQPSCTAITMDTAGRGAVYPVTMTTSGNSYSDFAFDSHGETPGGLEEAAGHREPEGSEDLHRPSADHHKTTPEPPEVLSTGSTFDEDEGQLDFCTSAESLEDCLSAGSKFTHCPAASSTSFPSDPQCRRSSVCFTPPPPHQSPTTAKRLLRSNQSPSSSSPVVKPYPPIFPSYIKTTTRQLSSPAQSPALSPSHSPLSPRRDHRHPHRYLYCCHHVWTVKMKL